ncbi:hypothetical protein O6H91_12G030100 [Diphasiastrum complanatum]|uniref:Uncharacterized protein n=1 Tax=Diphasiastrum complanatum TaxID=34168 RepID=A0ACC2C028_DIPCM|nr:hypothetical protein O6H91_12G030100 [Diphasiastrum complanatum]
MAAWPNPGSCRAGFFVGFIILVAMAESGRAQIKVSKACDGGDRVALLQFKSKITQDPSQRLNTWKGDKCCSWAGITCDGTTGRVVVLSLPGEYLGTEATYIYNMSGTISASLGSIPYLQEINLQKLRHISGSIPSTSAPFLASSACFSTKTTSRAAFRLHWAPFLSSNSSISTKIS